MTVVREFHLAFGLDAPAAVPLQPDPDLVRLRARLIREEYEEVLAELATLAHAEDYTPEQVLSNMGRLLKELADLRYVTEGCAVAFALPIEAAYIEVHSSNMSKLGEDGKPLKRPDGKVLKGPNYREADVDRLVPPIIEHQEV